MDLDTVSALIKGHAWWMLAATLLGVALRLSQSDTAPAWFTVPARWRPTATLVGSQALLVLTGCANGAPGSWRTLVPAGVVVALFTLLGHLGSGAIAPRAAEATPAIVADDAAGKPS